MPIVIKIFSQINNAFAQCTFKIIDVRLGSEEVVVASLGYIIHAFSQIIFSQINNAFTQCTFKTIDVRLDSEEALRHNFAVQIRSSCLLVPKNFYRALKTPSDIIFMCRFAQAVY